MSLFVCVLFHNFLKNNEGNFLEAPHSSSSSRGKSVPTKCWNNVIIYSYSQTFKNKFSLAAYLSDPPSCEESPRFLRNILISSHTLLVLKIFSNKIYNSKYSEYFELCARFRSDHFPFLYFIKCSSKYSKNRLTKLGGIKVVQNHKPKTYTRNSAAFNLYPRDKPPFITYDARVIANGFQTKLGNW